MTKRVFSYPVAQACVYMENGKKLEFGGAITGKGDQRVVGTGFYETEDPEEIKFLEAMAKNGSTMVTEVALDPTAGKVAAVLTPKRDDPTVKMAAADAAKNTVTAVDPKVAELREKMGQAIKAGAAADANKN